MKSLKSIFLLVLGSLFLLSACAGVQPSKPVITKPVPKASKPPLYVKHACWKSPFNPHEVLENWTKLVMKPLSGAMVMTILGNPKINWKQDYQAGPKYSATPVPEGEITSVVIFVFVTVDRITLELAAFGYKDKHGIKHTYMLDVDTNCYILKPVSTEQVFS